jgi:hypothetical protein
MEAILMRGNVSPLVELDKDLRKQDVQKALTFYTHKGASAKPESLWKLICKDVNYGYSIAIPILCVTSIPGLCMAPMNIMAQNTIDELGIIVSKDRLAYDQSWKWSSGTSINSRVQKSSSKRLACRYGFCIRWLVNWAVAVRRKYSNQHIMATKIDWKLAHQCRTLHFKTALQTAMQLPEDKLVIITLCLTFGGAPFPFKWGISSEIFCSLANKPLKCKNLGPKHITFFSTKRDLSREIFGR